MLELGKNTIPCVDIMYVVKGFRCKGGCNRIGRFWQWCWRLRVHGKMPIFPVISIYGFLALVINSAVTQKRLKRQGQDWPEEKDIILITTSFANGDVPSHPKITFITGLVGCDDFIKLYVVVNSLFQVIFVFPLFQTISIHYHTQKQWKNKNYLK